MRFARLGQAVYADACLRAITEDEETTPQVRREARKLRVDLHNMIVKYRGTLK